MNEQLVGTLTMIRQPLQVTALVMMLVALLGILWIGWRGRWPWGVLVAPLVWLIHGCLFCVFIVFFHRPEFREPVTTWSTILRIHAVASVLCVTIMEIVAEMRK